MRETCTKRSISVITSRPVARLKQLRGGGGGGEANWLNKATPPPRSLKKQTDQVLSLEDVKEAVDLMGKQ